MYFKAITQITQRLGVAVLSVSLFNIIAPTIAVAQECNAFGCSAPGAGPCNPFGCPNPGAGPCTPFGCPASPAPAAQPAAPPAVIYQSQPQVGGSPAAIADCMERLMYEERLVCTRSSCSQLSREAGFGGWELQTVRTEIGETTAAQACQNAR